MAGLVWAIGSILLKPLARLSVSDFQDTYHTNVIGAALAAQAAQQPLKAGKGSMVFFSSVAATQGFTNHAAISAAKAAVEGLSKALAAELAPDVRVNVIAPSLSQSKSILLAGLVSHRTLLGLLAYCLILKSLHG